MESSNSSTLNEVTSHQPVNDNQTTTIGLENGNGFQIRIQRELIRHYFLSIIVISVMYHATVNPTNAYLSGSSAS